MAHRSISESIPAELLHDILNHVVASATAPPAYSQPAATKRLVASCAGVCRYWARICRPQLFQRIALSTAQDLRVFAAMLDAVPVGELEPVSMLFKFVTIVVDTVAADGQYWSWLHHVALVLLPKLKNRRAGPSVLLRIAGSVGAMAPDRSLISALLPLVPRSLPLPDAFFTSLTFTDAYLGESPDALARALEPFPGVRAVNLIHVPPSTEGNNAERYRPLRLTSATSRGGLGQCAALCFLHALLCRDFRSGGHGASGSPLVITTPTAGYEALKTVLQHLTKEFDQVPRFASDGAFELMFSTRNVVWHIHREQVTDPRRPVLQLTSVQSYHGLRNGRPGVCVKRSLWLKYGPSICYPDHVDGAGVRTVTVVLRELHMEVVKADGLKQRRDEWKAVAERVGDLLVHLERMVLVSEDPADAENVLAVHRAELRPLRRENQLAVAPLRWGKLEVLEACGREEAQRFDNVECCGGSGGWFSESGEKLSDMWYDPHWQERAAAEASSESDVMPKYYPSETNFVNGKGRRRLQPKKKRSWES